MGVPVRDLLRLAPVLLGSASGPQFLQSVPLQAFWSSWCLVLGLQDHSDRHCSRLYNGCVSRGGTDVWFLAEHWRSRPIWGLVAHSLSGGLFKNVTFMPKTTPQCGVFMATVAEIFPGAPEMDRTNQSGNSKWFWLYSKWTREQFFVKKITIKMEHLHFLVLLYSRQ